MTTLSLRRTKLVLGFLLLSTSGICWPAEDPHERAMDIAPAPEHSAVVGSLSTRGDGTEGALPAPEETATPQEADGSVGHLRVYVNVPARVTLNGSPVGIAGSDQPLSVTGLAADRYQLTVSATGYETREGEVYIRAGEWDQEMVCLFSETPTGDAPESGDPGASPDSGRAEADQPDAVATPLGPADESANIVLGRCHMDECWWWRIERAETIGTKDQSTLIKLDVSTTAIGYRFAQGRDDESLYPDRPPPGAVWGAETQEVYVLCSMKLPALFSRREEDGRLVGDIPFERDGFFSGAAEGSANLWRFACGIGEDDSLSFDALSDEPHPEILLDAAAEIFDLL